MPELRVVNKGDARILVLDGEELRGAKQNRVLNTTHPHRQAQQPGRAGELHRAGALVLRLA